MAKSADDAGDGHGARAPNDGDVVIHVGAAKNVDVVSVGALLRGGDDQLGGAYAGAV